MIGNGNNENCYSTQQTSDGNGTEIPLSPPQQRMEIDHGKSAREKTRIPK
jgi:hypothetical protein